MGKVKYDEITYPYVKIELLDGQASDVGVNLKKVYSYIDEHNMVTPIKPSEKKQNILVGEMMFVFPKEKFLPLSNTLVV